MANENEVNAIEVKNQVYQVADKKVRDLIDSLLDGSNIAPSSSYLITYSDRTNFKTCSISSLLQLATNFGICYTEANNQYKSVLIEGFNLIDNVTTIIVRFEEGNTANDIELSLNGGSSYPIYAANSTRKLQTGSINPQGYLTLHFVNHVWIADTPLVKKTSAGEEFVWS